MAVLRMFIISPLMRARHSRRASSFHTFPLSPSVDRLFSLPFLSFHSLGVSYFLPSLSLFRPAVHDRPPIFAVNHVRSTFRSFKFPHGKHPCPCRRVHYRKPLWGGALSSGSMSSLSSICRRCAFLRFLRCSLPCRWSKNCCGPFNISLQTWHTGFSSIVPQIVPNSCGLSCCSSELAAAPLSLVLDAVGRRKRLCRGQGGQGGLPFFLLGFWVSCCSLGGPFLKHQDEGQNR